MPMKTGTEVTAMPEERVKRFSLTERVAHWTHAASFFLLILTGLTILSPMFHFLTNLTGGIQNARLIHRVAGVVFGFGTLGILILGNFPVLVGSLREIFSFKKEDIKFLQAFPKDLMGQPVSMPPQGRFNVGQKLNSLLVLGIGAVLVASGLMLWYAKYIPLDVIRWAYPLHCLGALGMTAAVIGHAYLGLLHPGYNPSLSGMIDGTISRKFAKAHHTLWYNEIVEGEEKK